MFFLQPFQWDLLPACFGRDNGCGKRGYLTVRDQTVRFMPSNSLLKTCQTLAKLQSSKNCVLSMLHVILLESSTMYFLNTPLKQKKTLTSHTSSMSITRLCVHPSHRWTEHHPSYKRIYRAVWDFSCNFWSCPPGTAVAPELRAE